MKVCVYAICKNEAQFVRRWMDSMGEADQIVVLEKGRIVDKGTQPELLSRCPLYQKLWQAHVGAQNWAVGKEA